MHTTDNIAQRLTRCSIDELHELVFTTCCLAANSSSDWDNIVRDKSLCDTVVSNGWTLAEYASVCRKEVDSVKLSTTKLAMKYAVRHYYV